MEWQRFPIENIIYAKSVCQVSDTERYCGRLPQEAAHTKRLNQSAIFPEITQPQCCWRLILTLFPHRKRHKYDYRYHIRQHLEDLLGCTGHINLNACQSTKIHKVEIQPAQCAEKITAPDRPNGFPSGKNDQSNRKPPQGLQASVAGPGTLYIIHRIKEAAQAGDHCTNQCRPIFVAGYADAG